MNSHIEVFREWAEYVIDNNDWDNAEKYLRQLPSKFWRQGVIAVRHLLLQAKTESQAFKAAYLMDEYLRLPGKKQWALDALRRVERNTYRRLGSFHGIENAIVKYDIASTPEGRAYLRSRYKMFNAT